MRIFENIINKKNLVFDIGSNIGDKSNIFLNLGSRVIGFEPQFECYSRSISRFRNNDNFICENIALDKKPGQERIYIASYHTISSMSEKFIIESKKERFTGYNWDDGRIVNTDTLDNMISKYGRPDFIKIDVEGYELNVLEGLTEPIKLISIEFNPELCDITKSCIEYIDSLNSGNTLFNYGYRDEGDFRYDNWVSKYEMIDYIESVNDFKFEFGDVYCKNTIME